MLFFYPFGTGHDKGFKIKFKISDCVSYEKFFNNSKISFKYKAYIQPVSGYWVVAVRKPPIKNWG